MDTKQVQINTFTQGMNTDMHPLTVEKTILTDCVNGTLLTNTGNEPVLQNDLGNEEVDGGKLHTGFIPVAMKAWNNILYIVSYNPTEKSVEYGSIPSVITKYMESEQGTIEHNIELNVENENDENIYQFSNVVNQINNQKLEDWTFTKYFPNNQYDTISLQIKTDLPFLYYKLTNKNNISDFTYIYSDKEAKIELNDYSVELQCATFISTNLSNLKANKFDAYNNADCTGDVQKVINVSFKYNINVNTNIKNLFNDDSLYASIKIQGISYDEDTYDWYQEDIPLTLLINSYELSFNHTLDNNITDIDISKCKSIKVVVVPKYKYKNVVLIYDSESYEEICNVNTISNAQTIQLYQYKFSEIKENKAIFLNSPESGLQLWYWYYTSNANIKLRVDNLSNILTYNFNLLRFDYKNNEYCWNDDEKKDTYGRINDQIKLDSSSLDLYNNEFNIQYSLRIPFVGTAERFTDLNKYDFKYIFPYKLIVNIITKTSNALYQKRTYNLLVIFSKFFVTDTFKLEYLNYSQIPLDVWTYNDYSKNQNKDFDSFTYILNKPEQITEGNFVAPGFRTYPGEGVEYEEYLKTDIELLGKFRNKFIQPNNTSYYDWVYNDLIPSIKTIPTEHHSLTIGSNNSYLYKLPIDSYVKYDPKIEVGIKYADGEESYFTSNNVSSSNDKNYRYIKTLQNNKFNVYGYYTINKNCIKLSNNTDFYDINLLDSFENSDENVFKSVKINSENNTWGISCPILYKEKQLNGLILIHPNKEDDQYTSPQNNLVTCNYALSLLHKHIFIDTKQTNQNIVEVNIDTNSNYIDYIDSNRTINGFSIRQRIIDGLISSKYELFGQDVIKNVKFDDKYKFKDFDDLGNLQLDTTPNYSIVTHDQISEEVKGPEINTSLQNITDQFKIYLEKYYLKIDTYINDNEINQQVYMDFADPIIRVDEYKDLGLPYLDYSELNSYQKDKLEKINNIGNYFHIDQNNKKYLIVPNTYTLQEIVSTDNITYYILNDFVDLEGFFDGIFNKDKDNQIDLNYSFGRSYYVEQKNNTVDGTGE